ncbi:transcriptional regulator [Pseudomonas aeruginosa]|nr:transcriptional regulator [Pseudomonas aeruginosa]
MYFLQRRRWVDERPVLIELIALDAGWCPGLLDHDLDTSLMSLLRERFGLQPTRCQLAMHPTALNAAQAEPLQLAPGSPALYLERLSYAEGQRVVEFDQEFWRPDALEIVLDAAYPGA